MTAMLCVTAFVGCGKSGNKSSSEIEPSVKIVEDNEGFWNLRIGMSVEECVNILGDYSEKNEKYDNYYWYFDEVNSFKTLEKEPIVPIKNEKGYCAEIKVHIWNDKIQSINYNFNDVGINNAAEIATTLTSGEEFSVEFDADDGLDITTIENHSIFEASVTIFTNVLRHNPTILIQ